MPTVADVALIWQQAGVSVIPIQTNQTKRPAVSWSPYQKALPTAEEVVHWWETNSRYGLAIICGAVSGNLEMTEIEGRALQTPADLMAIINHMDEAGAGPIWDLLTGPDGYAEDSPSGGMHLLYRVIGEPVPGNTKIASDVDHVVLAETRGNGGYVIVAPTGGDCHPSGEPWRLVNGNYGHLPTITWDERNLLHKALHAALDQTPEPLPAVVPAIGLSSMVPVSSTMSPGDDFERRTDWSEILEPHGWRVTMAMTDGERHWVRPGKNARDGMSATTGRANDRDRLYVFSTSTVFESEVPYTKFGAFALLNFGGDHRQAAQELVRRGFGEKRAITATADVGEFHPSDTSTMDFTEDDQGNGRLLAMATKGRYRYIWEEKCFYRWNGTRWVRDVDGGMTREWFKITDAMIAEDRAKWATRCRAQARINAAVALCRDHHLTHSSADWAPDRNLLNCRNGIIDLKDLRFIPHDAKYLMTHMMGTTYEPNATCPQFRRFMAEAVPNDEMRDYVQRALGYSLLGRADRRSIFLIYGPSGTGKSTLIETINLVLGDYAGTAGSGTFRMGTGANGAPTPDLHALRGKRFVTTSETAESVTFDEDLLKRLSGRDQITSRALYSEPVTWTPECVLWIGTNNPPKFNSDDDAIWRRTKLIPFTTVFRGDAEVPDYAHQVLSHEAPGILNWLLEGLADYLANGLQEPAEIEALALDQRNESDSVARFLQDRHADGLVRYGESESVPAQDLYNAYCTWASQVGERKLGNRRFTNRVTSLVPGVRRQPNQTGRVFWVGIGYRSTGAWLGSAQDFLQD